MNAALNSKFQLNKTSCNESWVVTNSTIKRTIALVLSNGTEKVHGKEVKFIVLCLIILAALLGNGFILWLISKDRRRRRSATNIFIASQCVTDFATSLLVIPFGAASLLQGGWMLGKGFAIGVCFLNMFFTALTLLHLAVIALDRYFAVVKLSHHLMKKRTALWIVIGCWTTAFMTSFPWLPLLSDKVVAEYFRGFLTCGQRFLRPSGEIGLFVSICAVIMGFPLAVITFSFYSIGKKIKSSRCITMPVTLSNVQTLQLDAYAKSAYTSFIVTLSSLIQVFPACIMMAIDGMQLVRIPNDVATAAKIVMWSHCAFKPIVYTLRKKNVAFGRAGAYLKSFRQNSSSKTQRNNAYIVALFRVNGDAKETRKDEVGENVNCKNESISPYIFYSCKKPENSIENDSEFDDILTIVSI